MFSGLGVFSIAAISFGLCRDLASTAASYFLMLPTGDDDTYRRAEFNLVTGADDCGDGAVGSRRRSVGGPFIGTGVSEISVCHSYRCAFLDLASVAISCRLCGFLRLACRDFGFDDWSCRLSILFSLVGRYERALFVTKWHAPGNSARTDAESPRPNLRDLRKLFFEDFLGDPLFVGRRPSVDSHEAAFIPPRVIGIIACELSRDIHRREFVDTANRSRGNCCSQNEVCEVTLHCAVKRGDRCRASGIVACGRSLLSTCHTHSGAVHFVG